MSEGLNLQTSGRLINYDMPWNLMRVEQRIGRVDRIGARYEDIQVTTTSTPTQSRNRSTRHRRGLRRLHRHRRRRRPVLANVEKAIEHLALSDVTDDSIRDHVDSIRGEVDDLNSRAVQTADMGTAPEVTGRVNVPPDLTGDTNLADLEESLTSNVLAGPLLQPHPCRAQTYRLALPAAAEAYSFAPTAGAPSPNAYTVADSEPGDLLVTFDRETADAHADDTTLLTYGAPELGALLPARDERE